MGIDPGRAIALCFMLNTLKKSLVCCSISNLVTTAPPKLEEVVSVHSCTILERISVTDPNGS